MRRKSFSFAGCGVVARRHFNSVHDRVFRAKVLAQLAALLPRGSRQPAPGPYNETKPGQVLDSRQRQLGCRRSALVFTGLQLDSIDFREVRSLPTQDYMQARLLATKLEQPLQRANYLTAVAASVLKTENPSTSSSW